MSIRFDLILNLTLIDCYAANCRLDPMVGGDDGRWEIRSTNVIHVWFSE